jgi:hypothetical protein
VIDLSVDPRTLPKRKVLVPLQREVCWTGVAGHHRKRKEQNKKCAHVSKKQTNPKISNVR